jgi:hypothetical protein
VPFHTDRVLLPANPFVDLYPQKRFKDGNHREAGALYSRSVGLSMGKPAWEQAKSSQDEITAALMNRSASAAALGEWYVHVTRSTGLNQDERRSLLSCFVVVDFWN